MLPAALGALGALGGGGGGLPGLSDQSTSSATASVNFAGMSVGGGQRASSTDLPDFLKSRLGGATVSSSAMPTGQTVMLLGAAALLVVVLVKMRSK